MNTKRLLVILVLVIAIYLILTALGRVTQPTKQAQPTPTPSTIESLPLLPREPYQASPSGTVIFAATLPSLVLPSTLPVYSLTLPEDTPEEAAQPMATRLGLSPTPTRLTTNEGQLLTWSSPTATIVVNQAKNSLSYQSRQTSQKTTAPTVNQADTAVRQFLTNHGLAQFLSNLVLEDSRLVDPKKLPPSLEDGQIRLSLAYRVMIDQRFPLYAKALTTPTVLATVDGGGSINSILVNFSGLPGQKLREATILPTTEIAEALNQGRGSLVSYLAREEAQKEFNELPTFTRVGITSGRLVYLIFEAEKLVRPVYLLDGTAQDPAGKAFTVSYILPAAN